MKRAVLAALVIGSALLAGPLQAGETRSAIFAGGCFWCVESDFDKVPGVLSTTSGYTGGTVDNPTYRQVGSGGTGHIEAVKIEYDPSKVTYEKLVDYFWRHIDPLDAAGQFCDKGPEYRSAIFVANDAERAVAEQSKAAVAARFKQPIATTIEKAATFWPAEDYHQDYYQKNTSKYEFYRLACRRDSRVNELWGGS